jgi:ribonuclease HII
MGLPMELSFVKPSLDFETQLGFPGKIIVGADEVGRGCLAGPVVAAAVALPAEICFKKDPWLLEIQDSKLMNPETRERVAPQIYQWARAAAVGVASVEEIDQINIFQASHLAIVRAIQALKVRIHHILIDGKFLPKQGLSAPATAVIKGDQKCLSIAAASVIAKVWRDQHMVELDSEYPGYGLAQHKGYPTPQHQLMLKKQGITLIHRRSFKTVAQCMPGTN